MANKEYSYAVGRRKESSATIKLSSKGTGNFLVKTEGGQEKTLQQYFGGNIYMYQTAISPLETIGNDAVKKFDAEISLKGGGIAGQADAIKLAFARALIDRNPDYRLTLKPYGHLKRDPRIKERKKPGLKKARKRPKRSKR
ncbi:MAG: 30S ribosomal protein S9 [candidate division SR1 bacterium CG_4_9_14_3_um_filter_40_9]|nr:MAG: 30S ribosomal protein S9 [candidate division SR1 bacterium CG_4_9_14_3_um_filter_40_9]